MRKKLLLHTKNTYILQLLLKVVTVGTETIVVSRNKFLYVCVKEVCLLWARPLLNTFPQLLIIAQALWSEPVLQVDKQVVVVRSEIMALRIVVKQLPVGNFQQCSSASSCMRTRIVMEEHYTVCHHSRSSVLNDPTEAFSVSQYKT
jgi:hypothetical protein